MPRHDLICHSSFYTHQAVYMTRVCLFNFPPVSNLSGYHLETFDPLTYFPQRSAWSLIDLVNEGRNGYYHRRAVTLAASGVDRLYRERNEYYMKMVHDFVERFRHFDLIIMSTYNFLHPEVLSRELKIPTKVLGFIDDPHSTYLRGIPYLWAFDAAFYISPSYIDGLAFSKALSRWTDKPTTWWPLVPSAFERPAIPDEEFFSKRDIELVYVGNPTGSKMDRLIRLRKHFGKRLRIHGRWRLKGYVGVARGLLGRPIFPDRIRSITKDERTRLYWRARIGFNMHVSDNRYETGNARMYELPAHGVMMVCDKAGADAHAQIFTPGEEAVYYDSLEDAIGLIEHYLSHDDERVRIARNGFERYWGNYSWNANVIKVLDWASSIRSAR
jgi:spore maturation protein CgeB